MAQGGPYTDPRLPPLPPLPSNPYAAMPVDAQPVDMMGNMQPIMSNDVVPSNAVPQQQPGAPVGAPPPSVATLDPTANAANIAPPSTPDPRIHGGRHLGLNTGQFGWALGANDFAPAGSRPNESRSTQVGKYGGAPLWAAALQFPDSVIASRLQGIAQERAQLKKAYAQFDPMAGVEDVNAPEYRDSFQRGVMGDINGYIGQAKTMWGDDEALNRLSNPTTQEGQGLRERMSHWTTVSRSINQATKNADAIIEGMDAGHIDFDQSLYDQAKQVRHKLGTYAGQHDVAALSKELPALNANVAFTDQMKQDGIGEELKRAGSVQDIVSKVKSGELQTPGFVAFLNKKTQDRSALVDSLTDYYARQYREVPREEIHRRIEAMAPHDYEEKLTVKAIPKAKGDGDGVSDARKYGVDMTSVPSGVYAAPTGQGDGEDAKYPTLNLMGFTNKQGRTAAPQTYRDGKEEVFMHPERLINYHGTKYIIGKETGMPRTMAEKQAAAKNAGISLAEMEKVLSGVSDDPSSAESQDAIQRFGTLRTRAIPYDGNQQLLNESLGVEPSKANAVLDRPMQRSSKPPDSTTYNIKGATYTLKQLTDMGYTPDQVASYLAK